MRNENVFPVEAFVYRPVGDYPERSNVITVYLTEREFEQLERVAKARSVPIAEVFRDLLKTLDRETEAV